VSVQQNDPTEALEVVDSHGQPTGRARPRSAVHLDGDWHQAFHCWIVRRQRREVVLQRRSLDKDTFGGCWDAAAAGHWRFGETAEQAAREIAEELGIEVDFSRLVYRGRERTSHHFANGLIDREFHHVYLLEDDRPLDAYRPDSAEVIALGAFSVRDLIELVEGRQSSIRSSEFIAVASAQELPQTDVALAKRDLVPYSVARLRRMLR
jgi:isopentenyldiphosphate isomerase